jgi:hypothetical protein
MALSLYGADPSRALDVVQRGPVGPPGPPELASLVVTHCTVALHAADHHRQCHDRHRCQRGWPRRRPVLVILTRPCTVSY